MVRVISFIGHGEKYFTVRTRILNENGSEPVEDASFFSFTEARQHISALRRVWLLTAFSDYVQHKVILYKTSGGDHYRLQSRLDALTRLGNAVAILPLKTTNEICEIIGKTESLLRKVLPHTANHSYEAQEAKIGQMLKVADDELSNRLGIFPFRSTNKEIYYT
jgi:hypothetical protein